MNETLVMMALVLVGAIGYLIFVVRGQKSEGQLLARAQDELEKERIKSATLRVEKDGALEEKAILKDDLSSTRAKLSNAEKSNTALETELEQKQKAFAQQFKQLEENKQQLKQEFQNLANKIFEEKGKTFSEQNKTSIEHLLKPFREQIDGFRKRVDEVHTETTKSHASIGEEIRNVMRVSKQLSDDASNLTTALKGDKKAMGTWGEVQLERTLEFAGLMRGIHYEAQKSYKDASGNRLQPDFIVNLPENNHLIIDSKVSLVDYDKAVAAKTDEAKVQALDAHTKAVRNHIDSLYSKDYTNLYGINSPNFVLMFMPIEPAFIEAMKHNRDLFDYGYGKNVIMVSHTTLMPILSTVAHIWKIDRRNEDARELGNKAGEIYKQVCVVGEHLGKLGVTLQTMTKRYNQSVRSFIGQQGLQGKVERFQDSASVTKNMPDLQPLYPEIDTRLEVIAAPVPDDVAGLPAPDPQETDTANTEGQDAD